MTTFRNLFVFMLIAVTLAAAADSELLKLAPPETRMLAGAHVNQGKATPFGRFVLSQMRTGSQDFQNFVALTQFDPTRDLDEILVATPGGNARNESLVMVRGHFSVAAITAAAKDKGGAVDSYQGIALLGKKDPQSQHSGAVAFLSDTVAIAGDEAAVRAAIDRRGQPVPIDGALLAKALELSGLHDAWMVSVVPVAEMAAQLPNPNVSGAMKGNAFQAIQQVSGGLSFTEVVRVSAEAATRSDKDATALADVVRFLASFLQMNRQAPQAQPLATVVDTMEIKTEGNVTKLTFQIPEEQLEKLIQGQHKPARVRPVAAAR